MALQIATPCTVGWKLDELDCLLDTVENDIEAAIKKQGIQTGDDYTNLILRMAGKTIVSMREIIQLCAVGYPDGALSIARGIYEHLIVLAFFENHKQDGDFNEYIDDYFLDYQVKRNKALRYESENCVCNPEETALLEKEYEQLKGKAHHKISGDYWWSGYPNFEVLVKSAIASIPDEGGRHFLHVLHFSYKRACVSIHSSCIGNALRLGADPEFSGISTAPTISGHSLPLWFATSALIYIFGVVYSELEIDYGSCDKALNELCIFYYKKDVTEAP